MKLLPPLQKHKKCHQGNGGPSTFESNSVLLAKALEGIFFLRFRAMLESSEAFSCLLVLEATITGRPVSP